MMQDVLNRFLAAESDVYLILQLKRGPETRDERYASPPCGCWSRWV